MIFSALSDHCPIVCSIMTEFQRPFITEKLKLDSLPGKFFWNADSIEAYSQNINHPDVRRKFQDFENQKFSDLDTSVAAFNKIILDIRCCKIFNQIC